MKLFLKTLTKGGLFTFLIVLALLAISTAMGIDEYGNYQIVMNIKLYLACTLCGYIIAFAGLIFETKLDPIIKRAIHFVLLLGGAIAVFATNDSGSGLAGKKVLIAIFLYTICYVVLFLLILAAKKIYAAFAGNEPEEQQNNGKNGAKNKQPEKYSPRFKK